MKQALMAVTVGFGALALAGCAGLQEQGSALFSHQTQPQQIAMEGGQPVQVLGSSQSQGPSPESRSNLDESSFMSDITKEATSTLKNEVSSSLRSAIRGALGR